VSDVAGVGLLVSSFIPQHDLRKIKWLPVSQKQVGVGIGLMGIRECMDGK
jgi:hypothetical protein